MAVLAAGAVWVSFKFDEPVRKAVIQTQGKGWKKTDDYRFITGVRKFGDWPWLMLVGGIGLAVCLKLRNRDWMRIIAAAMLASTIAGILANTSRVTTGRTRPRESPKIPHGFYGPWREGRLTIGDPPFNSFPSGHAATAFGFAGVGGGFEGGSSERLVSVGSTLGGGAMERLRISRSPRGAKSG